MKTIQSKLTAILCLACGTASLSSFPSAAAVAADDSAPTRTVSFADLDISKPAGLHTLYRRIGAAAREVCRPSFVDGRSTEREQACIRKAVDGAVRDVNSVALAKLHSAGTLRLASR